MADEDKIQRQMEFIIEQRAQFASDIGRLQDVVERLANASLNRIENLEDKVSALADAQIKTEENISALVGSQARTDERLNAFITVVERYIGKDRNGNSQG
jgi:hypothetical protein